MIPVRIFILPGIILHTRRPKYSRISALPETKEEADELETLDAEFHSVTSRSQAESTTEPPPIIVAFS